MTGGGDTEIDRLAAANGRGSRGADVSNLQQRLTDAGYDTQGVDGKWGANTQAAYDQYRADHPLPVQQGTGYSAPSGFDYNQIRGVRNNPNVTPEFLRQVEGVAQRVGAKPEQLMGVMSLETMGTFRPSVANPDTHATGLIQFMPRTAQGLGTSIGELSRMTPAEQLPWVEKYLPSRRTAAGSAASRASTRPSCPATSWARTRSCSVPAPRPTTPTSGSTPTTRTASPCRRPSSRSASAWARALADPHQPAAA